METPPIASIGALVGEPARALMLDALMDGRALTASELADRAGITRQTASAHLARLTDGGLLSLERQGRHRYFRLGGEEVAAALESLMLLGERRSSAALARPRSPERCARSCYDHLAGRLGVALLDSLDGQGHIETCGTRLLLSSSGEKLFAQLGIDWRSLQHRRRSFARLCLDWSERRHHLAGALGAALLAHFLENRWLVRSGETRALIPTDRGRRGFGEYFEISV